MSNEKIYKISSKEKNYFTMIPNVVIDMFTAGIINKNTFVFYTICKRVAGEQGVCFKGRDTLKRQIKCSTREIQKAKEELTTPHDFLNGKSLIILHKQDPGSQDADHIEIEDIWFENMSLYHDKTTRKKFPTLFPGEPPPVPIGTPPLFPGEHKEEPKIKKEHIKKERTSVHKSQPEEKRHVETCEQLRSSSLFKEDKNDISLPSEKPGQHIDDLYNEQLEWLRRQKDLEGKTISEKQLMTWVRKYELAEIAEALIYSSEFHEKQLRKNKGIKNFYAFVQARLDFITGEKSHNIEHNRAYIQNAITRGFMREFVMTKDYCYHQNNKYKEVYYHLPPEQFKEQIERCK